MPAITYVRRAQSRMDGLGPRAQLVLFWAASLFDQREEGSAISAGEIAAMSGIERPEVAEIFARLHHAHVLRCNPGSTGLAFAGDSLRLATDGEVIRAAFATTEPEAAS